MSLTSLALLLSSAAALGMWVWSFFLQRRCNGPYTLNGASSAQKWQWSIGLSLLRTILIPFFGLFQPLINPVEGQWSFFLVISLVIWLMLFFLLSRLTYRNFERRLRGWEEAHRLKESDGVIVSFGKSGRTWFRVLLSRYFAHKNGLPEGSLMEFDEFHRANGKIPVLFFSHDNYLKDYMGHDRSSSSIAASASSFWCETRAIPPSPSISSGSTAWRRARR